MRKTLLILPLLGLSVLSGCLDTDTERALAGAAAGAVAADALNKNVIAGAALGGAAGALCDDAGVCR